MRLTLVESRGFTARVLDLLDPELYRRPQNELLANPRKGDVIPGCGGLRKLRIQDSGRQKEDAEAVGLFTCTYRKQTGSIS